MCMPVANKVAVVKSMHYYAAMWGLTRDKALPYSDSSWPYSMLACLRCLSLLPGTNINTRRVGENEEATQKVESNIGQADPHKEQ